MTPEEMEARNIIEFETEEGERLLLELTEYFFFNGEEYAALTEVSQDTDAEGPEDGQIYFMKVHSYEEDGEQMEELLPVEEELVTRLSRVFRKKYDEE